MGTLISFATQPGNVALDGEGRNSPFASALVKHIATSTGPLTDILVDVRNDVMEATARKQVPWEHSALTGRFYFKEPANPPALPPTVTKRRGRGLECGERHEKPGHPGGLHQALREYLLWRHGA